jgi:hypothetical protein
MVLLAIPPVAAAQSDVDRFTEGRIALDKYKDCPAARKALELVAADSPVRHDPIYAFYMGRTYECVRDLPAAVKWYELYMSKVPATAELLDKMGDLRYRLSKDLEAKAKDEEAKAKKRQEVEATAAALDDRWTSLRASFERLKPYTADRETYFYALLPSSTCTEFVLRRDYLYGRVYDSDGQFPGATFTRRRTSFYQYNLLKAFVYNQRVSISVIVGIRIAGDTLVKAWWTEEERRVNARNRRDNYTKKEQGDGEDTNYHREWLFTDDIRRGISDLAQSCQAVHSLKNLQ